MRQMVDVYILLTSNVTSCHLLTHSQPDQEGLKQASTFAACSLAAYPKIEIPIRIVVNMQVQMPFLVWAKRPALCRVRMC